MALTRITGKALKDQLYASIEAQCKALQSLAAHAKTPEYRKAVVDAFFSIFDTIHTVDKEKNKVTYAFSNNEIAEASGYSGVMVGYYRTLWEGQDKTVTVEVSGGPVTRDGEGNFVMPERKEEVIAIKDNLLKMDVADLARAIRKSDAGERPTLSQRSQGARFGKRLLSKPPKVQADFLQGLAGAYVAAGSSLLWDTAQAVKARATQRKSKVQEHTEELTEGIEARS